ncbi:hypothetical protein NL676_007325 [Syzygium grande]|nr:hypothetical protein NL676_007325 [Syzygium grande]
MRRPMCPDGYFILRRRLVNWDMGGSLPHDRSRADCRCLGEIDRLKELSHDAEKLKIFRSNSFNSQSIADALRGCSGLFYVFELPQDQPNYDVRTPIDLFLAIVRESVVLFKSIVG